MKHPVKVTVELERAKSGDASAIDFICRYVWEQYGKRIWGLFSNDSADDKDDLQQIYWMAVVKHVPRLDRRGDPVYHLGQRGFWAVGAHIRRKESMSKLLSLDAPRHRDGEDRDMTIGDSISDTTEGIETLVVHQLGSQQQVDMILSLDLAPTAKRALDAILAGEAGDPAELGFNKMLAKKLGVSPQRASQAMASIRKAVVQGGIQV